MTAVVERVRLLDAPAADSARCLVCGAMIEAGDGLAGCYQGRMLRFGCPACVERFEANPERYLADHPGDCCRAVHLISPASEWTCD